MVVLKYGAIGSEVRKLQTALKRAGYSITVDGIFGSNTTTIVKKFQKKHNLTEDGIVGAKTWSKLAEYMYNLEDLGQAVIDCLDDIEKLPSFQKVMEMIDNV